MSLTPFCFRNLTYFASGWLVTSPKTQVVLTLLQQTRKTFSNCLILQKETIVKPGCLKDNRRKKCIGHVKTLTWVLSIILWRSTLKKCSLQEAVSEAKTWRGGLKTLLVSRRSYFALLVKILWRSFIYLTLKTFLEKFV